VRSWSDAPGGSGRYPPRGPRADGNNGYEGGAYMRRSREQMDRSEVVLNYDEEM
jgi:hypothetical protein